MKGLLLVLSVLGITITSLVQAAVMNVVLVHGAFADGSGWKPVATILERDGYNVYVVQIPETGYEADVTATRIVLDRSGPCVLVGHSWAGMIITETGTHESVRSLVYINAFQPDVGETAGALQAKTPPAATSIVPLGEGFLAIKPDAFHQDFAADVPTSVTQFMSRSQVPIAASSFDAKAKATAWSQKKSYAVVSTRDREINPELERFMSRRAKSETIELTGSHAIFLSHPKEIAALIEKAAKAAE
jgi:pimeloyl-ACP methyl ester carboxylesterase